jgi:branched-chain amino acid transport system substrate-binding protein
MRRLLIGAGAIAAAAFAAGVCAQQTVKIGLILPYSGQFADTATQLENSIKLYIKQHGDTVAGRKIEFVRKDTGGIAPPVAKRLAQELVVRDQVDILAGLILTPNALAVADISTEAKKFTVIFAATSIITTKSPYMTRTSVTIPQLQESLGKWAATAGKFKKVYTMVTDYGPGHDAEGAFHRGFKEAGGEIVGAVRMPVANPDFSAFVQRAKDLNPEAMLVWTPGGTQPAAVGKALFERGVQAKQLLGQEVLTDDNALRSMGDAALGIVTVANYDYNLNNPMNRAYVKAYNEAYGGRNPDLFSISGWDQIHLIFEVLKKTGGKTDGDALIAAAKGMKWQSPRGPMVIDPETRDVIQTVYLRRVEKVGGKLLNVEFDKIENVKDPVKARMK